MPFYKIRLATDHSFPYGASYNGFVSPYVADNVIVDNEHRTSIVMYRKGMANEFIGKITASIANVAQVVYSGRTNEERFRRGYPAIIATDATSEPYGTIKLTTNTISGLYRFGTFVSNYSSNLALSTLNVKVAINNNYYKYISFVSGQPYYLYLGSSGNPAQTSNYYTVAVYNEAGFDNEPPDFALLNESLSSTLLNNNFANSLWDFGDIPQEVPADFKTWVINNATEVYPYTFEVKSQNGETVFDKIEEVPAMKNAELQVIGNGRVLTLNSVKDTVYTMEWVSTPPPNKRFLGLSFTPNSNVANIPIGESISVEWNSSLILYEVYSTYRPPLTTFDITLYQNLAEVNRVDKSEYLIGVGTLSGALRDECSLITPSIVYQSSDVPEFNYVYIPIFNRYYYVTSLSSVSKNVWRMELNCDVLMSYKDSIFMLQGVIGRQENDFNDFLIDDKIPTQKDAIVEIVNPLSTTLNPFDTRKGYTDYIYALTVIGG